MQVLTSLNKVFQLTASQGGRRLSAPVPVWWLPDFNSRPHKEADEYGDYKYRSVTHFNSRPHKEADYAGKLQFSI